jgi:hypothetical protein
MIATALEWWSLATPLSGVDQQQWDRQVIAEQLLLPNGLCLMANIIANLMLPSKDKLSSNAMMN